MSELSLLQKVKTTLRIKNNAFDETEIIPLIMSAQKDMERVGIAFSNADSLCERAVILYCKGNFGYSSDGEKYQQAYDALRDSMSLSGLYSRGEYDV